MNIKDPLTWQVTDLEISKKLKELGVKQESLWYWNYHKLRNKWRLLNKLKNENLSFFCENTHSAYTVAELGELLPGYIVHKHKDYKLNVQKWCGRWQIYYEGTNQKNLWEYLNGFLQGYEETEANARGKMLVYLIENKLIDLKKKV